MPLRLKLVALYALILGALVGAICGLLPVTLRRELVAAVDAELVARAQAVAAVTELESGAWVVESKSGIDADFTPERGLYYVVRDAKCSLLAASPLARSLELAAGATASEPRERSAGGRRFRELALRVTKSVHEDEPSMRGAALQVICGKDLREVDFSVRSLVAQLTLLGPLALCLSLVAGWWLVGRALRPIESMAATAATIGEADLSRRLAVEGKDEVARLGRTLNQTFDRLEAAFERQQRFTADASHELRTPLAVVSGQADLALRRPRSADEYRESLVEIQAAAGRMQSVVDGLLTLARADAGCLPLGREPVSLRQVCADALKLHEPLAKSQDVILHLAGDAASDVQVSGDRARLQDLVGNLVSNAIRYNRRGGRVDLRLFHENGTARLEVADTGPGIAAEHLPHVFERFYRVEPDRSRAQGGAGLGLSIAQWVAQAHEGRIEAHSEIGRGSCFTVSLPALPLFPLPRERRQT